MEVSLSSETLPFEIRTKLHSRRARRKIHVGHLVGNIDHAVAHRREWSGMQLKRHSVLGIAARCMHFRRDRADIVETKKSAKQATRSFLNARRSHESRISE